VITSRLPRRLAGAAFLCGAGAWIWFLTQGLVLSHYDAKAHLVVARRVFDSITPGWQQIGAVWLPLPHLIQILPTQVDAFYRTGAFASLVSIVSFSIMTWAAARLVLAMTGSALGAFTAAVLLIANPNLLYLQSTPMTEPLMLAVVFVVLFWLYEWVEAAPARIPTRLGVALFAAAWTRYEAWLILAAALAAVAYVLTRRGMALKRVAGVLTSLAIWPAAAAALFAGNSRITTGHWLVTGGFYEVDPTYHGLALKSLIAVWWGTHRLSGYVVESVALAAAAWLATRAVTHRSAAVNLVPLTLFSAAALPLYGFFEGHPFRVRYMVVMTAACTLVCGLAVGSARRRTADAALAAILVVASVIESPPWSLRAAMIEEAQWDVPRTIERRAVTDCLRGQYHHEKILASMGSLAHYMQELSREGLRIADFIHEGNGAIWDLALTAPATHAGWMLIEEQSEGGDVLARRVREDAAFTRGMDRICSAGGVALYRRLLTSDF
jgi:hypothetical protein